MDDGSQDGGDYYNSSSLEVQEIPVAQEGSNNTAKKDAPKQKKSFRRLTKKDMAIWIAIAILIILAIVGILFFLRTGSKPETNIIVNTQSLDNGTLNQLTAQADGNVKQQLTISPDTIFKGSVEVQQAAVIKGKLTAEGETLLEGPVVLLDGLEINRALTVRGATIIGNNLAVGGQISAASMSVGTLTISSINLSNNLTFAGHLIPSGSAPSVRSSVATLGGNVSINGNDTAGTVTINTGTSFAVAGEMVIVTFTTGFTNTPKIQITPINAASSGLRYYVTRNANFFTVDTSTPPANGTSYVFDYFVTQ